MVCNCQNKTRKPADLINQFKSVCPIHNSVNTSLHTTLARGPGGRLGKLLHGHGREGQCCWGCRVRASPGPANARSCSVTTNKVKAPTGYCRPAAAPQRAGEGTGDGWPRVRRCGRGRLVGRGGWAWGCGHGVALSHSPVRGLPATRRRPLPTAGFSLRCRTDREHSLHSLDHVSVEGVPQPPRVEPTSPSTFPSAALHTSLWSGVAGVQAASLRTQTAGARKDRSSHNVPSCFPSPKISTGGIHC